MKAGATAWLSLPLEFYLVGFWGLELGYGLCLWAHWTRVSHGVDYPFVMGLDVLGCYDPWYCLNFV